MKSTTATADQETATNGQSQATIDDLKALIRDAKEALANVDEPSSINVQALRDRLDAMLSDGRSTLKNLAAGARRQAARADDAIRENPYPSIGIAAGVGLVAGLLLSRAFTNSNR
jgi:ElaB/YqjD/DUF883 family membrane-anchored ribosome-binding protein